MKKFLLFSTLLFGVFLLNSQANLVLKNVNYFDVHSGKFKKGSVQIVGDKISKVARTYRGMKAGQIIDAEDQYLIPGMIDAHIHFFQSGGIYARPDVVDLREFRPYNEEREWVRNQAGDFLDRYLSVGVTSVIDVGGPFSNYDIRDQYSDAKRYPNIFVTGPLISTYQPEAWKIEDPPIIKCRSIEEALELVRKQAPLKPDFIKIWYIALPTQTAESTYEIVAATISESHRLGIPVAVHATQLNTAKLAIKAGADILVHSVDDKPVDDVFIDMLVQKKVIYIPSMVVSGNYGKTFLRMNEPSDSDLMIANPYTVGQLFETKNQRLDSVFTKFEEFKESMLNRNSKREATMAQNLKALSDKKAIIATGTDAGNIGTLHASSYYSEIDMMKKAGMSNAQILIASTINGAKVVGKDKVMGSIANQMQADLVLLNSNPLEDLNALKDIKYIIKGGRAYKPDDLISRSPEDLVQMQLNAYNAGNIDAFLYPYAKDLKIYNFPEELSGDGLENIKPRYESMFEKYPKLHCELIKRVVMGNTVIDQERVTGFPDNQVINAIAIYKIKGDKISEVYFIKD